jgi:UDP-3-O-[3-hydroxymyristoyl] N-acetylglucosamine deacetylase
VRKRRTIAAPVVFRGIGIHSGESSSVRLLPLHDGHGICFSFGGNRYPITDARVSETRRSTSIAFPGGQTARTVEHLLASFAGLDVDDVTVETEGEELPIMDGSALPFAEGIMEAGIEEKDEPAPQTGLSFPICADRGASSAIALPSDELRITYVIDYPGALGTEMKDVILTPEAFMKEIAPARTFGLRSEIEALRRSGLARGGRLDNALIIGENGPENDAYRLERECAAHKMLDLLGDLSLAGTLMRAHYICIRGGHELHAMLTDRVRTFKSVKGALIK